MIDKIAGKVTSVFSDNINTDDIIAGGLLQESTDRKFFAKHAFAGYDPEFIKRVEKGKNNIIIAGENFGSGSSREQAIYALQENFVKAVIAKSFPDIFYRNALNNGLILIRFSDVSIFGLNQMLEILFSEKKILYKKDHHSFDMDDFDKTVFALGGKTELVRDYLVARITNPTQKSFKRKVSPISDIVNADTSPGQTITEKIVSNHVGRLVYANERIEDVPIDIAFVNDAFGASVIEEFHRNFADLHKKHGVEKLVFDNSRVIFVVDHDSPPSQITSANNIMKMKEFSREQNCKFYGVGEGIEHIVLNEDGYILPGNIVLGTDSHTCTNGAFNCLAFGVGTTDMTYALATGRVHDFVVPETIRVNLHGNFRKGVYGKDMILYLIGLLGHHGGVGKVLEFGGPALKNLSIDTRTTISNMTVELGARTGIFDPDFRLKNFVSSIAKMDFALVSSDKHCKYSEVIDINLDDLEPMVAFPHKPDNVTSVTKMKYYMKKVRNSTAVDTPPVTSIEVTNAFLGACTNGKYEDFVEAAKIIRSRKVHPNVDFVVIPASRRIYNRLLKEGIIQLFAEAGASIESSTCGPCFGKHKGLLHDGGSMISSSNRNFIGRMGSKKSYVFLGSPATVTASAIEGRIVDPREYM